MTRAGTVPCAQRRGDRRGTRPQTPPPLSPPRVRPPLFSVALAPRHHRTQTQPHHRDGTQRVAIAPPYCAVSAGDSVGLQSE